MIHYSLLCADGHEFDSWFKDSASYDSLIAQGLVSCPFCQGVKISKAVMAPHIGRRVATEAAVATTDQQEVALLDEKQVKLQAMIQELRETIVAATEDVGESFPQEARKIQDGDAEQRPIRGRASLDEAKALIEDGIEIFPIPGLRGDGN